MGKNLGRGTWARGKPEVHPFPYRDISTNIMPTLLIAERRSRTRATRRKTGQPAKWGSPRNGAGASTIVHSFEVQIMYYCFLRTPLSAATFTYTNSVAKRKATRAQLQQTRAANVAVSWTSFFKCNGRSHAEQSGTGHQSKENSCSHISLRARTGCGVALDFDAGLATVVVNGTIAAHGVLNITRGRLSRAGGGIIAAGGRDRLTVVALARRSLSFHAVTCCCSTSGPIAGRLHTSRHGVLAVVRSHMGGAPGTEEYGIVFPLQLRTSCVNLAHEINMSLWLHYEWATCQQILCCTFTRQCTVQEKRICSTCPVAGQP